MKKILDLQKAIVLPNGVDLEKFKQMDRTTSCRNVRLSSGKKIILFAADPRRPEKNFELALKSFNLLKRNDTEMMIASDIPNESMCDYYNAADILLLTSLWEGSPNTVKEAMACGLPVLSTPVGDTEDLLDGVENSYVCSFNAHDFANKIESIFQSGKRTNGRERILKMKLDSSSIAIELKNIYTQVLEAGR